MFVEEHKADKLCEFRFDKYIPDRISTFLNEHGDKPNA